MDGARVAQVALEAGRRAQLAAGAVSDAAEIIGFGFFFSGCG